MAPLSGDPDRTDGRRHDLRWACASDLVVSQFRYVPGNELRRRHLDHVSFRLCCMDDRCHGRTTLAECLSSGSRYCIGNVADFTTVDESIGTWYGSEKALRRVAGTEIVGCAFADTGEDPQTQNGGHSVEGTKSVALKASPSSAV